MIKAILFDLDGTLANTLKDLANAVNYVLEKNNYPIHNLEDYRYMIGSGIPNLLTRALPEQERTEEKLEVVKKEFFEYYSKHFADDTVPYEGVDALLRELKQKGIKLAVITNKAQEMTELVMAKLFKKDVFGSVVGKREGNPVKPDPKPAFIAISELCVNSDECIFVGDSGVDILTARNCGALPVGVLWGFRSRDELEKAGAKFLLEAPSDLIKLIDAING